MADGSIKEYRYGPHRVRDSRFADDTLGALLVAYRQSPEWRKLADRTRQTYNIYLRDLERDPHAKVSDITRRDLLAMRDAIAATRGDGAATGFVRSASALFNWAVDREWIENTPMTRVKALEGGHLPTWKVEHVYLALENLSEPLRRVVLLAAATGQRRGDLVGLKWSDYDGQAFRFVQQKTAKKTKNQEMVIPVPAVVKAELAVWKLDARQGTILKNDDGDPWVPARLTESLRRGLRKIPGFPENLSVHGIRKFKAADLANKGASVHQIAAVTGHRTLAMVALYTEAADQEKLAGEAQSLGDPKKPRRR